MASRPDTIMLFTDMGRHCTGKTKAKEHARVTGRGDTGRAASIDTFFKDSGQALLSCTASSSGNSVVRARRPGSRPRARLAAHDGRGNLGEAGTLR
eukprot:4999083-Amphidinium_carterae.1